MFYICDKSTAFVAATQRIGELDGSIRPLLFREEDGPAFRIDRVLDVRQAASRKAGGQGIRYVCEVEGSIAVLFHDEPYWFIEREESVSKA